MTHPSVEDVALHLEGVLGPADELRVRTHLAQCEECAVTARQLRGVTDQLHAAAAPESTPPIPADVAARVESALARESAERAAGTGGGAGKVAASATAAGGTVAGRTVGDLDERRRRRRRVLSGGVLAAAAATVVAVGLGQLTQTGVTGQSASGDAGSVAAERAPAQSGPRRDAARGGSPQSSALSADGQGRVGTNESGGNAFRPTVPLPLKVAAQGAGLIEGVAAAHSPDHPGHDLPGCVRAALGDGLGPVASYSVQLPGGNGAPGVVVLRPNRAPTQGVLVACSPQPHVLARRGLRP